MKINSRVLDYERQRVEAVYARRKLVVPPDRYSHLNLGNLLNSQELERAVLNVLRTRLIDLSLSRILDIGCGEGGWIREFIRHGARPENITGIDLLSSRIATARHLCPSSVTLTVGNAARTCFADGTFDIVLQSTVFSSVLSREMRGTIAAEMLRVTRQGGLILWYDFFVNNPRNKDVVGICRREIIQLFPQRQVDIQRLTLLPPFARFLGPKSRTLFRVIAWMKLLSTHYLAVISKE